MYTTFDCDEFLYVALRPALKDAVAAGFTAISGDLYYKNDRPNNSKKEDIDINTPSLSTRAIQQGYSNINIYVPVKNITRADGGHRNDNRQRVKQIARCVVDTINLLRPNNDGIGDVRAVGYEESPDGTETFYNVQVFWNLLNRY